MLLSIVTILSLLISSTSKKAVNIHEFIREVQIIAPKQNAIVKSPVRLIAESILNGNSDAFVEWRRNFEVYTVINAVETLITNPFDAIFVHFQATGIVNISLNVCFLGDCIQSKDLIVIFTGSHGNNLGQAEPRIKAMLPLVHQIPAAVGLIGSTTELLSGLLSPPTTVVFIPPNLGTKSQEWYLCIVANGDLMLPETSAISNELDDTCYFILQPFYISLTLSHGQISGFFVDKSTRQVVLRTDFIVTRFVSIEQLYTSTSNLSQMKSDSSLNRINTQLDFSEFKSMVTEKDNFEVRIVAIFDTDIDGIYSNGIDIIAALSSIKSAAVQLIIIDSSYSLTDKDIFERDLLCCDSRCLDRYRKSFYSSGLTNFTFENWRCMWEHSRRSFAGKPSNRCRWNAEGIAGAERAAEDAAPGDYNRHALVYILGNSAVEAAGCSCDDGDADRKEDSCGTEDGDQNGIDIGSRCHSCDYGCNTMSGPKIGTWLAKHIATADIIISIDAHKASLYDSIDADSFLQARRASGQQAVTGVPSGLFLLQEASRLVALGEGQHKRSQGQGQDRSLPRNKGPLAASSASNPPRPLFVLYASSLERLRLPYGFQVDAIMSPNVGLLEHETVAQFHWPSYLTRIWLDHRQTVGPPGGASPTVAHTTLDSHEESGWGEACTARVLFVSLSGLDPQSPILFLQAVEELLFMADDGNPIAAGLCHRIMAPAHLLPATKRYGDLLLRRDGTAAVRSYDAVDFIRANVADTSHQRSHSDNCNTSDSERPNSECGSGSGSGKMEGFVGAIHAVLEGADTVLLHALPGEYPFEIDTLAVLAGVPVVSLATHDANQAQSAAAALYSEAKKLVASTVACDIAAAAVDSAIDVDVGADANADANADAIADANTLEEQLQRRQHRPDDSTRRFNSDDRSAKADLGSSFPCRPLLNDSLLISHVLALPKSAFFTGDPDGSGGVGDDGSGEGGGGGSADEIRAGAFWTSQQLRTDVVHGETDRAAMALAITAAVSLLSVDSLCEWVCDSAQPLAGETGRSSFCSPIKSSPVQDSSASASSSASTRGTDSTTSFSTSDTTSGTTSASTTGTTSASTLDSLRHRSKRCRAELIRAAAARSSQRETLSVARWLRDLHRQVNGIETHSTKATTAAAAALSATVTATTLAEVESAVESYIEDTTTTAAAAASAAESDDLPRVGSILEEEEENEQWLMAEIDDRVGVRVRHADASGGPGQTVVLCSGNSSNNNNSSDSNNNNNNSGSCIGINEHNLAWLRRTTQYPDVAMPAEFTLADFHMRVIRHVAKNPLLKGGQGGHAGQGSHESGYLKLDSNASTDSAAGAGIASGKAAGAAVDAAMGQQQQQQQKKSRSGSRDRILCVTYTISSRHEQIKAILDTWGKRCDGYIASSNLTEAAASAFKFPRRGPEAFGNIWQKVRATLLAVEKHFFRGSCVTANANVAGMEAETATATTGAAAVDRRSRGRIRSDERIRDQCDNGSFGFDWVFVSGDDTYVLMESLRAFLASHVVRKAAGPAGGRPVFMGQTWSWNQGLAFNHGGGGYLMNAAALRLLASSLRAGLCSPYAVTSMEDVMVANCLRSAGVLPLDTRDAQQRLRFHHASPGSRWTRPQESPEGYTVGMDSRALTGLECCARDSVTFHFIKEPVSMRLLHHLFYYSSQPAQEDTG